MSFGAYPRRKDSGARWIGMVPAHWLVKRIGYFFLERREKVSDKEFAALSVTKNGIVPQLDTAAKTDDGDNRKRVCTGDFVINSRSDRKGSSGASELDGSVSLICTVLRPQEDVHAPFVHHLLRSKPFQEEFYRNGKGIVADLWSTNFSEMRNILLAMPAIDEQTGIARFLDRETAKIDGLVAAQQRLIDLLEEKRQAVISHAVTKGLNPHAPMKPSGIDWVGNVPAHWQVIRMTHLMGGKPKNGLSPEVSAGGTIPTFSTAALRDGVVTIIEDHLKYVSISQEEARRYLVSVGDVLVLRGSGSKDLVGKAGIVEAPPPAGCIYPDILIRVRPNRLMLPEFMVLLLNSSLIRPQIETSALTAAGIWKISGSALRELQLPSPPPEEQREIVSSIGREVVRVEALKAEAERTIDLLHERRSALISAAVTGQIDVRSLAEVQPA